jgi:methylmalonyl-CoA/ethylmalonyl-CoA epimerase
VKLVEPTEESSGAYALAQKGGGLHHLAFKCKDIHTELTRLQRFALRVLTQPEPGEAFENEEIAFVFAKHGLNIELIDTDKRAKRLPSQ